MAFAAAGSTARSLLLATTMVTAAAGPALAGPFGFLSGDATGNAMPAEVVPVQMDDAQYRIGQLEEQLRNLNGRIEELSFQIIQMQEQMRQMQEDNEFRFQQLEGGGAAAPAPGSGDRSMNQASPADAGQAAAGEAAGGSFIASGTGLANSRSVGTASGNEGLPGLSPDLTGSTPSGSAGTAPGERSLGQIIFDSQGNVSTTLDGNSVGANGSGAATASLSTENPDAAYAEAYNLLLSGDYAEAETAFRNYVDNFPDGNRVADASFWLGESQFSQGEFNDSARTFLNAHQSHPGSEKAPEMLLKLGMSLARLDNRETACATYREVLTRYPDVSPAVRERVLREQSAASC